MKAKVLTGYQNKYLKDELVFIIDKQKTNNYDWEDSIH